MKYNIHNAASSWSYAKPIERITASTQPVGTPGFSSTVAPNEPQLLKTGESRVLCNRSKTLLKQLSRIMRNQQDQPIHWRKRVKLKFMNRQALSRNYRGIGTKHTQSPAVNNEIQPSITQPQAEVTQNQSNDYPHPLNLLALRLFINSCAKRNRNCSKPGRVERYTIAAKLSWNNYSANQWELNKPTNPIVAEEKRSPPHEPMSLLVLGDAYFLWGKKSPNKHAKAIDKLFRLLKNGLWINRRWGTCR